MDAYRPITGDYVRIRGTYASGCVMGWCFYDVTVNVKIVKNGTRSTDWVVGQTYPIVKERLEFLGAT